MYTSIVVPLDGSAFGKRALPVALALARRSDAAVHLVHAYEPIVRAGGGPMYDTRLHDEQRREMRNELTALAARVSQDTGLRVDAAVLDGPVVPTLHRYLAGGSHDLVVMMTHGRGGLSRAWLGSVADGLVRSTPTPLLLVRPGAEWPNKLEEPLFCHVLVPLDGSAAADTVLDHAVSLSTPDETAYTLLTVVVPLPVLAHVSLRPEAVADGADVDDQLEGQRVAAQRHLTAMAKELRESGALVDTRVVTHQWPAQGILDVADGQRVDSIALSTHGRGGVSRLLLGSVADKVVRGANVPVLIFRPPHAAAESAEHGRAGGAAATGGPAPASPRSADGERVA